MVMRMIYNVNFYQKSHVISMFLKFWSQKSFLFLNFYYYLIPPSPMVMQCNEIYEENKIIEVGQV